MLVSILFGALILGAAITAVGLCVEYLEIAGRDRWLRGLTLESLQCRVYTHQGQVEPDGKVYFDSAMVVVEGGFRCPEGRKAYPFVVRARFSRPDGTAEQRYDTSVSTPTEHRFLVSISRDATALRAEPGRWTLDLELLGIGPFPMYVLLDVSPQATPEEDLELVAMDISSERDGRRDRGNVIVTGSGSAVLRALFRPLSLPLEKFGDCRILLRLECGKHRRVLCSLATALAPCDGLLRIQFHLDCLPDTPAEWKARLQVGERTLCATRIAIVTPALAAKSVSSHALRLLGVENSGQSVLLDKVIYASEIHSLVPEICLRTAYPTALLAFRLECELAIDGAAPVTHSLDIVLASGEERLQLDGFSVPQPQKGCGGLCGRMQISLEGRCLFRRDLVIVGARPKFAAMQARLLRSGRGPEDGI